MQFNILILDDEKLVCNSIRRIIREKDRQVFTALSVDEAIEILQEHPIDLLLLDYKLGTDNGISFLKELREYDPDISVIMITAHGNIDIAVEAMKLGAYDFIQKKVEPEFIRFIVQRALDNLRLKKEVEQLKEAYRDSRKSPDIISNSRAMKTVIDLAKEFAKSDSTVLIGGETGTGKNLLAEYIHRHSTRFSQSFVTINCAAIPSELIESELFGYESGAFTGARQKGKKGLIEQANGGTLFLDEVGELSLEMQSKLLQVLEQNEYLRVGAVIPTSVDVRFIAATNSELAEQVEQKEFRMDLFYRLNVASVKIPPLRERQEDILPLAKYFIEKFNSKFNKSVTALTPEVESFLKTSDWQGNVRELRNYIERAMLLIKENRLRLKDFTSLGPLRLPTNHPLPPTDGLSINLHFEENVNLLHEAQKQIILKALDICQDNVSHAAQLLGIPRTSLNSCIQRFNIKSNN